MTDPSNVHIHDKDKEFSSMGENSISYRNLIWLGIANFAIENFISRTDF